MSALTRPLRPDEVGRLWPAVRGIHAFGDKGDLETFQRSGPWRVRVSDRGDVLLLARWRAHLDVMAIRALIAPPARVAALVDDARSVARSQGLAGVLSPVVTESAADEYLDIGMRPIVRLIAYTAGVRVLCASNDGRPAGSERSRTTTSLRLAGPADAPALVALDASCFEEFWRLGPPEVSEELAFARVIVVEDADGEILGYASAASHGSVVTLSRLAVAPGVRRQGVARMLISNVAAWALDSGALSVSLATQEDNTVSRSLYRGAGFDEVDGVYLMLVRDEMPDCR